MISHKELARISAESYHHANFSVFECEVLAKYQMGFTVIAARGTEASTPFLGMGVVDLLRDILVFPWYNKDVGWIHFGILQGGIRVARFIMNNKLVEKSEPLVFTGHSLGGGVSLVTAKILKENGYDVREWVGLGA